MTTESQQHINSESDEISLKELIHKMQLWWRYLLSKWLIILISGLLGGALGLTYAYFKKPIYTATTTFVLEDDKSGGGLGSLAGLASMAGVDVGGGGGGIFQGDNILELYKSRKMVLQTLLTDVAVDNKRQTLAERYVEFNRLSKGWAGKPALKSLKFEKDGIKDGITFLRNNRLRDSVIGLMIGDISLNYLNVSKLDKKLGIIKVDVKSEDEFFAKAFNEAIVKNVNDFYSQTKTKKSLQNVQIMQHKTDSVRAIMNGSIYSAVAIADATPNLNPTRQVQRVAPAQKAQFSAETNKAILSTLVQSLEMSKVALLRETPLLEVIDQPVYPLAKESLGKAKSIIIGGMIAGFIMCLILVLRRLLKLILA